MLYCQSGCTVVMKAISWYVPRNTPLVAQQDLITDRMVTKIANDSSFFKTSVFGRENEQQKTEKRFQLG